MTRYITTIRNVHEVTLAGAADADYWRRRLAAERLYPALVDGKAQLALGGTALRWLGLPFCELIVSVAVSSTPDGDSEGWQYLAAAFNSSRLLAALERGMFRTPYKHARLRVDTGEHPGFELRDAKGVRLAARSGRTGHGAAAGEHWWEGRIFLPRSAGDAATRYFCARLGGPQTSYVWQPATDSFVFQRPDDPLARMLAASSFEPLEWRIRTAATHSRSNTVQMQHTGS